MSLTVKAFYGDEIRRFGVDVSNASSFDYLEGKVRNAFPNLPGKGRLQMKWKDAEGDLVTFSTDEELVEALSSAENGVFKMHVVKKNGKCNENSTDGGPVGEIWANLSDAFAGVPPMPFGPHAWPKFEDTDGTQQDTIHLGITCDGCEKCPINGKRFKCKTCLDYDLCLACKTKGVHSEHSFDEIPANNSGHPFWHGRGRFGGRCGRGRGKFHKFHSFHKMDTGNSSAEEGKVGGGPLTKEEREKMKTVVDVVKEAAKTQAFEIGGAVAGDCAGESVVIAVRSSIRRALIVQKRSGLGTKLPKKKCSKVEDSSSSSEDTETEELIETENSTSGDKKKLTKKQIKVAAKNVGKIAHKEVTEHFGKLAGNWAAHAVRQSVLVSIKHCLKNKLKQEKKASKKVDINQSEDVAAMEGVTPGNETNSNNLPAYQPLSMKINNMSIYPQIVPNQQLEQVPVYASSAQTETPLNTPEPVAHGEEVSREELAILDAITAFQNMGFSPDEKLLNEIRLAKGDIMMVFENMKGK